MSKTYILAGAVALAVAGGAYWSMSGRTPSTPLPSLGMSADAQEATATSEAAVVPDMVLGVAEAPVEVIEYASFTCPHCAHFHEGVFDKLKADYITTGKVRFVYREVYFDKVGLWAAMVARCGGPEKYFAISDMIFDTQKEWIGDGDTAAIAENLRKIGLKAGIDKDALEACLNDSEMAKSMVATYQANATRDRIESTPSFLINGQAYSGAMSYDEFKAILDEKLGQ